MFYTNRNGRFAVSALSPIMTLLLCAACSREPAPEAKPATAPEQASSPKATGLVKNPVKLSDTADAVKWMDMASTKSPAQIAKEEKLAQEARDAKLAAEAKQTRDAKAAVDAKAAAEAKLAADARAAAEVRALAAKQAETQKAALAAQAAEAPKAAPVAAPEPVLKLISKEEPKYPKAAAIDGIKTGMVTVLMHVETDGHVSKVDIVKATPKKYFDKTVVAAAMQWKYAPISKPVTTTFEFNFKMDGDGS